MNSSTKGALDTGDDGEQDNSCGGIQRLGRGPGERGAGPTSFFWAALAPGSRVIRFDVSGGPLVPSRAWKLPALVVRQLPSISVLSALAFRLPIRSVFPSERIKAGVSLQSTYV